MLNRKAAEAKLIERAAQDPQFRASLLADPRAAIQKEFGVTLPEGEQLNILEEKPNQHYLVLPLNPETAELGAAQLDAASAGDGCYLDCGCDVNCDF